MLRFFTDPDFIHLTKTNKLIEERRQIKEISLNEKTRRKEKKELETIQISLENDRRKALGLKLIKNLDEFNKSIGNVDDDDQNAKEEKKKDGPTPLLTETGHILVDYLNLMHPGVADRNTNNNDSI